MATFQRTIPLLVQDAAVSGAMTTTMFGDPALRVVDGTGFSVNSWTSPQATQVTNSVGSTTDASSADTVIGLLKRIVGNLS